MKNEEPQKFIWWMPIINLVFRIYKGALIVTLMLSNKLFKKKEDELECLK